MTLKQKETNQHTSIDIHRLIQDANTAQSFKNLFPDLQFQKVGATLRADKNSILLSSIRGTWCIKFFKDSAPAMPIFQAVEYANQLQAKGNKDHFFQVCEILASISGNNIASYTKAGEYYTPNRTAAPKPPQLATAVPYKPNSGPIKKTVQSFAFAQNGTSTSNAALQYIKDKIKAPKLKLNFLDRVGVHFLESSTHKSKNGKKFAINYTMQNPSIAFCTNPSNPKKGSIKTKRPYEKNKDYKTSYIQSQNNYIFCYHNLPKQCKVILICGGETDTLAINYHYNQFSIFAICLSGETTTITPELLADLRKRTPNVFTLFDNDKGKINKVTGKEQNTGLEASIKAAVTIGMPFIDTSLFSKENDICDILQAHNKYDFLEFITNQIHTRSAQRETRFSPAVPVAYKIDIGENYFDDVTPLNNYGFDNIKRVTAVQQLVNFLILRNRLILSGWCGIGKSTMIQTLINYRKQLECERIIFVVPTQIIAKQQQKDYMDKGLFVPVIMQGSNQDDYFDAENSNLIICVSKSLAKIDHLIDENCFLIGDEMHLQCENIYQKNGNKFLHYAELAGKTLVMSATINTIYTTDVSELLRFELLKVIDTNAQTIPYYIHNYTGGTESDVFSYYDTNIQNRLTGATFFKMDNVAMLEAWDAKVKASGRRSDINSSKYPKYKEENANYKSITENGTFAEPLDYYFATSLADTGLSIKSEVSSVVTINERCPATQAQAAARPRYNKITGVNGIVESHAFLKVRDRPTETYNELTSVQAIKKDIAAAEEAAIFANQFPELGNVGGVLQKFNDKKLIYWETLKAAYVPDLMKILGKEESRKQALMTNHEIKEELSLFSSKFKMMPEDTINLLDDTEVKKDLAAKKAEKKELKNDTCEIIQEATKEGSIDVLFESYYHSTTDMIKSRLKELTHIEKEPTAEAVAFTEKYKKHFEENAFDRIVNNYFIVKDTLESEASEKGTAKPQHKEILAPVLQNWKTTDFKEYINSKIAEIEINKKELNGIEALRVQEYNEIIKNVTKAKARIKKAASRGARETCLFSKFDIIDSVKGFNSKLSNVHQFELEAMTGIKKDHNPQLRAVKELFTVKHQKVKLSINDAKTSRIYYKVGKLKTPIVGGCNLSLEKTDPVPKKRDKKQHLNNCKTVV